MGSDVSFPETATPFGIKEGTYSGKISRVIDGDTFEIIIRVSFNNFGAKSRKTFFTAIKARLFGIDCAEKNTVLGQEAKRFATEKLSNKIVKVEVLKKKEKFGRVLVNIELNGQDFAKLMLGHKHNGKIVSREYFGEKKKKFN